MILHHVLVGITTCLILFARTPSSSAQPRDDYALFKLATLGGNYSFGSGIDERGIVVGSAFLPSNFFHATVWIDGVPVDIESLGGLDSQANDSSEAGWIVGWSRLPGSIERAFLWRDGRMEDIGTLGGDTAEAHAINEAGQVVGESDIIPGQGLGRAFIWEGGQMTDLGGFESDRSSQAYDINAQGHVVGRAGKDIPPVWAWRAVLWRNGEMIDLGSVYPDHKAEAHAINDSDQIVGFSKATPTNSHATLWFNGRIYDLGTPGTRESAAYDINNAGQIVGFGYSPNVFGRAFLWEQSRGMQALISLAPPRLNGIGGLTVAWAINDAGQIAGTAYPPGDPIAGIAFLMSPVSPTMTLESPSPGSAGTNNTITITNATPGAHVTFLYSRHGGGTRIPGCDLQQNALQLDNPTVIGTAVANEQGVATITRPVPLIARGQTILFQAVVQGECAISQLVVWRFE